MRGGGSGFSLENDFQFKLSAHSLLWLDDCFDRRGPAVLQQVVFLGLANSVHIY